MSMWQQLPLGEIFEIARGGSPRPIQDFLIEDSEGVNWIMIGDASGDSKFITSTKKRIRKEGVSRSRMVFPGDFLLTNSMSFGHPYILKIQGCIHDGWLVLSRKRKDADHDFFYHLLGSPTVYKQFERRAAGAVVKNLNIDIVSSVQVPLPPLAEQKRIAAILDKADAIRKKRKKALELADSLLSAAYNDICYKGCSEYGNWKYKYIEELGGKHKNAFRTGPFGSALKHSEFTSEGIAVLGIDNAVNNKFAWAERRYVNEEKYSELKRYTVYPGDVIITIMGTTGRSAVVPNDIGRAITTKHLATISLDRSVANPVFLSHSLHRNPDVVSQINAENRGAIMSGLNLGIIKQIQIKMPPLERQNLFADVATKVEQYVERTKRSDFENKLFASISTNAFRGEL